MKTQVELRQSYLLFLMCFVIAACGAACGSDGGDPASSQCDSNSSYSQEFDFTKSIVKSEGRTITTGDSVRVEKNKWSHQIRERAYEGDSKETITTVEIIDIARRKITIKSDAADKGVTHDLEVLEESASEGRYRIRVNTGEIVNEMESSEEIEKVCSFDANVELRNNRQANQVRFVGRSNYTYRSIDEP